MNIDQFIRVYKAKMIRGKKPRVKAIKEYFTSKYDQTIDATDSEDLLQAIISFCNGRPEAEQQVFSEISEILFDRYSMGNPFILFNIDYVGDIDQLCRIIKGFLQRKTISRDMFDFEPIKNKNIVIDRIDGRIRFKLKYKEFKKDLVNNQRTKEVIFSGQIPIIIDILKNKLLINCGYQKAATTLVRAINDSLGTSIRLTEINIAKKASVIPNLVSTSFEPLTLLSISLILNDLKENDYFVNDIISVNFNNEEAPRVKNARLSGNSLLQDMDVIHRFYKGDRITNFVVMVIKLNQNGESELMTDIMFDFRGILKIQFGEASIGSDLIENAVIEIEEIINSTLTNQDTVGRTEHLILTNLPRIHMGNDELIHDMLIDLRNQLCKALPNDGDIAEEFLNDRYRL